TPAAPADVAVATSPAPKLEHADSAVIIRRHDTLWQISRRVYGQGMRYSTIYLANQDQIRNPDRIWPGQVFKVPEKSQEGEAANLKAMGDQMTTAPTKAD
ncbi:MAG: LysM peptidoglycan-binding domain-containing protein, partial [Mesorhizobium sp.]